MKVDRKFKFNWRVSVFSVFFFVAFVNLGFWQLERAEEKEVILASEKARQEKSPVSFHLLEDDTEVSGLPVRILGKYESDTVFLLDNRVLDGKVGFEVLVPFRTEQGQLVLVNRGFVRMGRTRQDPPLIPELVSAGAAVGHIHIAEKNRMTPEENKSATWPMIVQSADPVILQAFINGESGKEFYPYIVRLALGDDNALPRYWPATLILPAKHTAYAVQWFSMAIAIALAFLFFSFRKDND